jgi:uncharacterized protein (TIGR00297 family)
MQTAARRRAGFFLAGLLVTALIFVGLGWGGVAVVAAVLAITLLTTRIGRARKQALGLNEPHGGRDAWQVFANIGAAAIFALTALRYHPFGVAAVAALAAAAADTSQSEIGEMASRRAWSITTWREVPPGTDGGVTVIGTLAGAAAALVIAAVAAGARVIPLRELWVVAAAGFLGTVVDSLLGATLERREWLNNNGVNFLGTLVAGAVAICAVR